MNDNFCSGIIVGVFCFGGLVGVAVVLSIIWTIIMSLIGN